MILKHTAKISIQYPQEIYQLMQRLLTRAEQRRPQQAHCWSIGLNREAKILSITYLSVANPAVQSLRPRDMLQIPLQKGAFSLIVVQTQPEGKLNPSAAAKDTTDRLIQACRLLELTLYDHLIINQKGYYSFKLTGLLAELAKSTKYRLPYEQDKGEESQEKDGNAMSQPN